MTRFVSDSQELDHVTILLARVCAARLDTSIAAEDYVRMVARLVDVAVAEAEERWAEEQRASRSPAGTGVVDESALRAGAGGTNNDDDSRETSSTGAAGADSSADHQQRRAASDASAAPSSSVLPAAERLSAAPSREGADSVAGGAIPDTAASEPGSPGAALPIAAESAAATHAAETPRARAPKKRKLTDTEREEIRHACLAARRENGGALPIGWLAHMAEVYGVKYNTLYSMPTPTMREPLDPPAQKADHTNSHACWCRKGPNNKANPWCSNAPVTGVMPGLRSRVPPTRDSGQRGKYENSI